MKDLVTIKGIITIILTVALLWLPPSITARPNPPPAAAACIVTVIGVAVVGTIVYGLWRMCEQIPAPDSEPPPWAPISELPGMGPPSYMHTLPTLKMRDQIRAARVSLQHQDQDTRGAWQTDYTFIQGQSLIGGVAMVAYDPNGIPLLTNDVPTVNINGENWAGFDFTILPAFATNNPPGRIFRLMSQ